MKETTVEEAKSLIKSFPDGSIKSRFRMLFIKMLSLKFLAFAVQIVLGIIWFRFLVLTEIGNSAVWGIWSGYMVGAFTIYTAGNVSTKKVTGEGA